MYKQISLLVLLSALAVSTSFAQKGDLFAGTWEGTLKADQDIPIIFHIEKNKNGGWTSSADSPLQSAYGIPCDATTVSGNTIAISMKSLNALFEGSLLNDSIINGNFTQGVKLPLTLRRSREELAEAVADSLPYSVDEVLVPVSKAILSATFFQPDQITTSTAILLIAGSGPTDRDGNNPIIPGKNNSLLQLADSLARRGFAVLRYDKRGIGKSKLAAGTTEDSVTITDMIQDAVALYHWLKKMNYDQVYFVGHSEGSLVGMSAATQVPCNGFVSLEGAGRKATDILKEQFATQLDAATQQRIGGMLDSLAHGMDVVTTDATLLTLFRPSVQPYMKSWLPLDPAAIVGSLSCPVLIIQGTRDIQTSETDAKLLAAQAKSGQLVLVKNMNHVLKIVNSSDRTANIQAYSKPDLPVANEVISSISNFILTHQNQ